ncbi:MAG: cytochrome c maturation protein CcmE [Bryobacterales bacterium]
MGGDVVPGSIVKSGDRVEFVIQQVEEGVGKTLNVVYTGQDPLPDTFRDRAQALCDGELRADGAFEAKDPSQVRVEVRSQARGERLA